MTRLLIASGVRFYRDGLAQLLAAPDATVVATPADWPDAVRAAASEQPDAALIDAAIVPEPGRLQELKAAAAGMKLLVIALRATAEEAVGWIEAGADGFVPHDATLADLRAAIAAAVRGEVHCSPEIAAHLFRRVALLSRQLAQAPAAGRGVLTAREQEVVKLIAEGLTNKGISRHLGIRIATTKNHVHNILSKLGLERRAQLASWFHRQRGAMTGH
ncbi:MAG TPA: response regulator transcription factor [Longimicrobiales bacterium]